jgi:hypothetical protein
LPEARKKRLIIKKELLGKAMPRILLLLLFLGAYLKVESEE